MPQTLLALCTLVLVTTFALNQRELTTNAQLNMMRNEIAMVASGVANRAFDQIGALPFDGNPGATTPNQFTQASQFGGGSGWDGAGDIDDMHGKSTVFVVPTEEGELEIAVAAEVTYVRKVGFDFQPTTDRGFLKQVTLTLDGPLGFQARLSRVYSYYDTGFGV